MKKPKASTKEWNEDKHEATQTLTCQTLILEFLHWKSDTYGEVAPATSRTVQEFWNYLEQKKEELRKRGQNFEEKVEYNEDWLWEQKYDMEKRKHKRENSEDI